jgi:hypothetical protein
MDLPTELVAPYRTRGLTEKAVLFATGFPLLILGRESSPGSQRGRSRKSTKKWTQKLFVELADFLIPILALVFVASLIIVVASLVKPVTIHGVDLSQHRALALAGTVTLAFANLPPKVRHELDEAFNFLLVFVRYLSVGEGRRRVVGELYSFIETIIERQEYARVDIVAYSLGSLIEVQYVGEYGRKSPAIEESGISLRESQGLVRPDLNLRYAINTKRGLLPGVFTFKSAHQSYFDRQAPNAAVVFDTIVQVLFPVDQGTLGQSTSSVTT